MGVYPKMAHEVLPIQAISMIGCGCAVKNPGPAMRVYPIIFCMALEKSTGSRTTFLALF